MSFGKSLSSLLLVLAASLSPPVSYDAVAQQDPAPAPGNSTQVPQLLVLDTPTDVNGIETVCTGIDSDSRNDPRWAEYPLRLEFAAGSRAYVADETVGITGGGTALQVRCPGPWLLAKLPAGKYNVVATVEGGVTKSAVVNVPRTGRVRAVLHFPEVPAGESNGGMAPEEPAPEPHN
jgi:hypothetical protein